MAFKPRRPFRPAGRAYTSYLRNTGQLQDAKVVKTEVVEESRELQRLRVIQRRNFWNNVFDWN